MNLYIQTENGVTVNHPAYEANLLQAFGSVPSNWIPFVRVHCPVAGTYQVFDSPEPTYEYHNDVWTDVWSLREMDAAEIVIKDKAIADAIEKERINKIPVTLL